MLKIWEEYRIFYEDLSSGWDLRAFSQPLRRAAAQGTDGREVGATLGLLRSLLMLLTTPGITHVACAFDRVIESFRNDQYSDYKTGAVDHVVLYQHVLHQRGIMDANGCDPATIVMYVVSKWNVLLPLIHVLNELLNRIYALVGGLPDQDTQLDLSHDRHHCQSFLIYFSK